MDTNCAILTINSKIDGLKFCAFDQKIVFGTPHHDIFEESNSFEVKLNDLPLTFQAFFYIVKSAYTADATTQGAFLKKSDLLFYTWEIIKDSKGPIVLLFAKANDTILYKLQLSILQFNDVVLLLSMLILPALNVKDNVLSAFKSILALDLEQIIKLKCEKELRLFLTNYHKEHNFLSELDIHCISLLAHYHLDILVAIHNIKSLYNSNLSITKQNIDMMLSCE